MNNIKILIEQELKDFIKFLYEKDYCPILKKEYSKITPEILQKYIDEYLERI